MAKKTATRAELAAQAGVTKQAITKAMAGPLSAAACGDRVDLSHPVVVSYLARKRTQIERKRAAEAEAAALVSSVDADIPQSAEDIDGLADLTVREVVQRHGTVRGFKDWLDALKKIEDIRKTRLDNDETEGTLIDRELVKTHVFGAIESGNRRLLQDFPKSAAIRVMAAFKSGATVEETERLMRDLIGTQLKPVKTAAARTLRDA